jgi:uncharacterized protein
MYDLSRRLKALTPEFGRAGLFLSGGVDSTALLALFVATFGPARLVGLTATTPFAEGQELDLARSACMIVGVEFHSVPVDTLADEDVTSNSPERCYYCKRLIAASLISRGRACGADLFADGSNADDLRVVRPGLRALKELGVFSPLAALGVVRRETVRLAKSLPNHSVRGSCMASRFATGIGLDDGTITSLRELEHGVRAMGFPLVRCRYDGRSVTLEVAHEQVATATSRLEELRSMALELGFGALDVNLFGYSEERA